LWQLARGQTATQIAETTGYSRYWIGQIAGRYNLQCVPEYLHLLFLPVFAPELQPAEHLWPLTNTALVNRHFASIEDLEEAQLARCAALQRRPDLIRSTILFHWCPKRIKKRQGPRPGSSHV
jgi:transposase